MQTNIDVLVVDHSDADTEITLQALRRAAPAVAVLRLKDGDQALQFMFSTGGFRERRPGMPRLILLDVDMPFVNGLQVLAAMRRDRATNVVPVVLLSSSSNPFAIDSSFALGACDYVVKPADFTKYCAEVGRVVARWLPDLTPAAAAPHAMAAPPAAAPAAHPS